MTTLGANISANTRKYREIRMVARMAYKATRNVVS